MNNYTIRYGDTLTSIARNNGTTVAALMQSNPTITDPNRIYAGRTLNIGPAAPVATPTPMPTPTPTAPTIQERASQIPDTNTEDPALSEYYRSQRELMNSGIDERKVRNDIRDRYNTQFDSLRIAAAQKIAEARKIGEGQLGSGRAIQARSGTLGSNFATAENDNINKNTNEVVNSINAETEAKIAFLMGESEKDYSAQIAAAREAKKAGADEYIKYISTRDSQREVKTSALAKLFASQGIDPSTLSKADIAKLESTYGTNLSQFKVKVDEEKTALEKAKAGAMKDNFFELGQGETRWVFDPATGEAKQIAYNPKTATPKAGGTGTGTGSGTGGSGSGAFSSDLDALIGNVAAGITAKNQREAFNGSIKRARNDQDKIATIAKVLNITGPSREDLTQTALGQNSLRNAVKILKDGTKTGVIRAGQDYVFNLTGNQVDPKLTQLKQLITAAIQPYRSSVTGAAWGPQEESEYRSMFGSVKDTPEVLLTKLENLDRIMTNKRVGIVQSFADPLGSNSSFDSMYSNYGSDTPTTAITAGDYVRMQSPSGQIKQVPSASVSAALKAGYKQL